jgi:threonine synthase
MRSTTAISGLQVGSVLAGDDVIAACRELGGTGYVVADETVFAWQARLAREEGIFSEPAGAVALAGVEQAASRGELAPDEHAVCLVTGSGFKDERSLVRMVGEAPTPLVGSFEEFANAVRSALQTAESDGCGEPSLPRRDVRGRLTGARGFSRCDTRRELGLCRGDLGSRWGRSG